MQTRYSEDEIRRLEQPYEKQAPEGLAAHLLWRYVSDVLEGGHLQFFATGGASRLLETIEALQSFQAICHASVLQGAGRVWTARPREGIATLSGMLDAIAQGEFAPFDEQFDRCSPSWQTCLQRSLAERRHQDWPDAGCSDGKAVMRSLAAP